MEGDVARYSYELLGLCCSASACANIPPCLDSFAVQRSLCPCSMSVTPPLRGFFGGEMCVGQVLEHLTRHLSWREWVGLWHGGAPGSEGGPDWVQIGDDITVDSSAMKAISTTPLRHLCVRAEGETAALTCYVYGEQG